MIQRDKYHHGDLRNALLSATLELVREQGTRGFSVSEAARRAGVSISAPYRHFADREALLAAAAQHAFGQMELRFATLDLGETLTSRAERICTAYLAFAQEDPARFDVMFAAGIDKARHPSLLEQTSGIQTQLEEALAPYVAQAEVAERAAELWSIAHGVATLTLGGHLHHVVDRSRIVTMAASAARTWVAGVPGVHMH
ncbi:TetR/AcrR family transcriptional regulator [Nesterenkonia haasae]|uniref:TetR/AcrR family transcriptional regulator n=1 Tax=Nesterenkonia haasae TaxID=2587813 RepID=UPI00139080B7|nr:TetR/AcrR family transcriptional regulator [Nesterenkonia haasae]NDK32779.1 TetR/AcrR family transcriptional regulator [Nesterenkonia haasae]